MGFGGGEGGAWAVVSSNFWPATYSGQCCRAKILDFWSQAQNLFGFGLLTMAFRLPELRLRTLLDPTLPNKFKNAFFFTCQVTGYRIA